MLITQLSSKETRSLSISCHVELSTRNALRLSVRKSFFFIIGLDNEGLTKSKCPKLTSDCVFFCVQAMVL